MPSVRRALALLALPVALLASGLPAGADSVDLVFPLGGSGSAEVAEGGRATVVGVLLPKGVTAVSAQVKAARGVTLIPHLALRRPDGTTLNEAALVAQGATQKVKGGSLTIGNIPIPSTGLYKLLVTGDPGTSGAFTIAVKGKPSKGFSVPTATIGSSSEIDSYTMDAPENGFATIVVKPAKGSGFGPSLSVLLPSGAALDLAPYRKVGKDDSITVKNLPLPYFGDYRVRVGSAAGTGGYSLSVKVAAKKPKVDPSLPVAETGPPVVAAPGTPGAFDGTGSSGGATLRWEQVSGDPVSLVGNTTATPSFTAPSTAGTRAWQLVVTTPAGPSRPALAILEVDRLPVAYGGASQGVNTGALVTMDGSGSFDIDAGDALTWRWTQLSGPPASLATPFGSSTGFTPSSPGTYVFELRVHDGVTESPPDRVIVVAGGTGPVADAGAPILVGRQESVFLSGARSRSAAGGGPSGFAWTRVDSDTATLTLAGTAGPVASFSAPKKAASLRFRLAVEGDTAAADEVQVLVSPEYANNATPYPAAGGVRTVPVSQAFSLDGSGSIDPDGTIGSYEWLQLSGTDAAMTGAGAVRNAMAPGGSAVMRFLLMVQDGRKYGPPDYATVVSGTLPSPVADAGPDRSGNPGALITFSSAGSMAPPGQAIVAWQWTQTSGLDFYDVAARDGSFVATDPSPQFTVPTTLSSLTPDRPMTFSLVVTDDLGTPSLSDKVTVTFTNLRANLPPQVTAGTPTPTVRPGAAVSLTSVATDPDGDSVSYSWSQLSGPPVVIVGGTLANASFTAPVASGPLVFRVTVDDGTGTANGLGTSDVTVTLNQPPALTTVVTPPAAAPLSLVLLDATGTTDPDDASLAYQWQQLPGDALTATLSNGNTRTASFTVPTYSAMSIANRRMHFRVTVTDSLGPVTRDVDFVPNRAPVLNDISATKVKVIYNKGSAGEDKATLSITPATDADGDTLTFSWTVVSG